MPDEIRMALVTPEDFIDLYWGVVRSVCDLFKAPHPSDDDTKAHNNNVRLIVGSLFKDPYALDDIPIMEQANECRLRSLAAQCATSVVKFVIIELKLKAKTIIEMPEGLSKKDFELAVDEFYKSKGIKN